MRNNYIIKFFLAVFLLVGVSVSATAQLKGVLNKAKKAVKEKTEKKLEQTVDKVLDQTLGNSSDVKSTVGSTAGNTVGTVAGAASKVVISSGPEIPELMSMAECYNDYDATGKYINNLVWGLRTMPLEEAKALSEKLTARVKWCLETLSKLKEGGDLEVKMQLNKEVKNWQYFYYKMGSILNLMNHVHFKKDENGLFYYQGDPMFMSGLRVSGNEASEVGVTQAGSAIFTSKNGKSFFCSANLEPIFAEEEQIRVAKLDLNFAKNMAALFEGYPLEWCRSTQRGTEADEFDIYYNKATTYASNLKKAIDGNSLSNLEFKPMPKAGSMNASMKAKALAAQKSKNRDVVDVVVVSNSWDVKKNALGVPIRRVIQGYSISQTKHGKMATNVSWAEEYEGGKYGPLRPYGVGFESFYVK